MKREQKDFINEVVLPVLIDMAIEGTLPMDMTELSYHEFEELSEKFNKENYAQERIARAGEYLSGDDDVSVEEMVVAIEKHPDQAIFIDYVDGVTAWEKVEHEFTCEQFLELIK